MNTEEVKTVTTNESFAKCPYCGEAYSFNAFKWNSLVESNPHAMSCDGEDGCGKDFKVIFSD